jgi:TctA family transporter
MDDLAWALAEIFTLRTLGTVLLAAAYGVFFGAIPGLTATMAVALIVPVAYQLDPLPALAAVITLSACAIFAGDIPCALVRIPGTPASAAYTDDVYAFGRRGRGGWILGRMLVGSVTGGLFGTVVFILLARPLARVATEFAAEEYFWFYLLGLGCGVVVTRGSALKGALALLLGLLLSTVGFSPVHAQPRLTFGREELLRGIEMIPVMIGLFGVSEVLRNALTLATEARRVEGGPEAGRGLSESVFGGTLRGIWDRKWAWFRSSSIGTLVGILPGAGADIAAWVSYGVSRRLSRKPEEYGQGSVEGVSDASAANNASLAGAWVPALVFGIPGDSITAIVIGIMMMKNLRPGPEIFERQGPLVLGICVIFVLANLVLVPLGFLAVKAGTKLVRIPRKVLLPLILLFCVVGSFAINASAFDIGVMLVMGLVGLALDRWGVPLGPVVLGLVLGGSLEEKFHQVLAKSQGSLWPFVNRPIAAVLAVSCLALWLSPLAGILRRRLGRRP